MDKLQLLIDVINRMVADERLSTSHLSLSVALCHVWIDSGFAESYQISRKKMMGLSHIHSIATYHKLIKELQSLGYIIYRPSYHPTKGSTVKFILPDISLTVIKNESIVI